MTLADLREALTGDCDPWQPWREQAACRGMGPERFFPEQGGSTREARAVCAGCEVREECLEFALEERETFGLWGGTSERKRKTLRQRVPKTERPHGSISRYNAGCRCEDCTRARRDDARRRRWRAGVA